MMSLHYSSLRPLSFLAFLLLAVPLHAIDERILSTVPLFGQETPNWCWAASVKMVVPAMYGTSQCSVVQQTTMFSITPPPNCCDMSGPCSGQAGQTRHSLGSLGYSYTAYDGAIPFLDRSDAIPNQGVRQQIDLARPFVSGWRWIGCETCLHEIVVFGYSAAITKVTPALVWIRDPMPVGSGDTWALTYDEFSTARRSITRTDPYDASVRVIEAHRNIYSIINIRPSGS